MNETEFERIEIPTPFHIGPINCYAFLGDDVTLLDPGPATDEAYATLRSRLEEEGYGLDDVERILVTHPHMDHFGIANRLKDVSDAELLAHEDAVERIADPDGYLDREQAFFEPFLASMGMPEQVAGTTIELPEPYATYREPVTVDETVAAGERVDVGAELEVVHTPGHSPGSVCFVDPADGAAFTGDHVLAEISPNPLLTLEPGTSDRRTRSLPTYLESLRKLREIDIDVDVGYAGHRGTIPDVGARVTEIIDHHHDRKETFADVLEAEGPMTAYQLMQDRFPDLPATEMFPGMSEVIGHLDLLEDEGRVEITESDGVRRYELA